MKTRYFVELTNLGFEIERARPLRVRRSMKNIRLFAFLPLTTLFSALTANAQSPTAILPPPPSAVVLKNGQSVDDQALALVKRSLLAYQKLSGLSANVRTTIQLNGKVASNSTTQFHFARPGRLKTITKRDGEAQSLVFVSDGLNFRSYVESQGPQSAARRGVASSGFGERAVATLFAQNLDPVSPFLWANTNLLRLPDFKDADSVSYLPPHIEGNEAWEGVRVVQTFPDFKTANKTATLQFEFDALDGLLRRTITTLPSKNGKLVQTTTYSQIQRNPTWEKGFFVP